MIVTRFAPSPTGRLHAGNIRTALVNWLLARRAGGRFLLRLDDTDRAREVPGAAAAIRDDLAWLGIAPDGEVRQSERFALYDAALATLAAAGRAYPAWDTPDELEVRRRLALAAGRPPVYDRAALALDEAGRARAEAERGPPHWRFRLDTSVPVAWEDGVRGSAHIDPASLSDPVVRRADGGWLYLLPSVVDDIELGVTDIVRGEDHVANSAIQLQMFAALGAAPPRLAHLALLTGTDAALSKRLGSEGVDGWRAAGIEPLAVAALLARIGTSRPVEPVADLAELVATFDLGQFGRAPARFDPADLAQLSAKTVHRMPFADVAGRLPPGMDEATWLAIRSALDRVDEAGGWQAVIDGPVDPAADPADAPFLDQARAALAALPWEGDVWRAWTGALKAATGRGGRTLFQPLRRALTGREHGPEMAALLPLIGRERALERLGNVAK